MENPNRKKRRTTRRKPPSPDQIFSRTSDLIVSTLEKAIKDGENGGQVVLPWSKVGRARSVAGHVYTGMNAISLGILNTIDPAHEIPIYATFKQWKALGASVRSGTKGRGLLRVQTVMKEKEDNKDEKEISFIRPTAFTVFNISQVEGDGLQKLIPDLITNDNIRPRADILKCLDLMGVPMIEGGDNAFYHPSSDAIHMPPRKRFVTSDDFDKTLLHELVHASGRENRLNRKMDNDKQSPAYAREELIAEMGAAMLAGYFDVSSTAMRDDHIPYLRHWLEAVGNNPNTLSRAAAEAEKASKYIIGLLSQ